MRGLTSCGRLRGRKKRLNKTIDLAGVWNVRRNKFYCGEGSGLTPLQWVCSSAAACRRRPVKTEKCRIIKRLYPLERTLQKRL